MNKEEFVPSSGNVFIDMGLEDADGLMIRARLGRAVRRILEDRALEQQEIARWLGADRAEVSRLMKGKYHLFSEDRLLGFLNRLNPRVEVPMKPHRQGEPVLGLV
ncbi:MAG: helix-turn-helix domain-containing protein [Candidatus Thiosymbion ectosymbiont of Robbea hypermnestra]|nr:helix-turn-helix domain-containing protein [Candidatus Thiosymbion ectosymbiont of Robbea hypermnestra]